jgi:hypothetical protein
MGYPLLLVLLIALQTLPPQGRHPECFAFLFLSGTDEQKETEREEVKAGKLFVGVRGFIRYRDVFDRERETSFRYVWKYSSMYNLGGDYGNWVTCGAKRGKPRDIAEKEN